MKSIPKNIRIVAILVLCAAGMGVVAYASVPLYRMFCSKTGYGGTTQRSEKAPTETRDRWIKVSFDSNVDPGLPWDFKPEQRSIEAKVGETYNITYVAHNRSDETIAGEATYNVQPDLAGSYFDKIQCFCFEQQVLKPGQEAKLAVQFYIDPSLVDDPELDAVKDITLSYTFFRAKDQSRAKGQASVTAKSPAVTTKPKPTGNPS